jgi:hypothetical protein
MWGDHCMECPLAQAMGRREWENEQNIPSLYMRKFRKYHEVSWET